MDELITMLREAADELEKVKPLLEESLGLLGHQYEDSDAWREKRLAWLAKLQAMQAGA